MYPIKLGAKYLYLSSQLHSTLPNLSWSPAKSGPIMISIFATRNKS
uniref:Uncharacterized protein n=1 Tax=Rhizophora mucronata TaxID=61149 RepID=A0A2P2JFI9_RHIMU